MSGLTICGGKKTTAVTLLASAAALVATGFLFACGYDLYARLFKKQAQ